jgi:hypothetical protein
MSADVFSPDFTADLRKAAARLRTLSVPDDEIAGIRERRAKITPGPWEVKRAKYSTDGAYDYGVGALVNGERKCIAEVFGRVAENAYTPADINAAFIAHAPTDIDTLLSVLTALQSRVSAQQRDLQEMARDFNTQITEAVAAERERCAKDGSNEADRDAYIKYRLATAEEEFDIIRKQLEAENANLIAREADARREERERCAKVAGAWPVPADKCDNGMFYCSTAQEEVRDAIFGIAKAICALSPSQEGKG